jgi:hypothetical protein
MGSMRKVQREALEQMLDAAFEHLRAGRAMPAELLCQSVLAAHPRHARALEGLALAKRMADPGPAAPSGARKRVEPDAQ